MQVDGHISFKIISRTADAAIAEMPVQAGVRNPFGTVHAGAMLWFADVTATLLALGDAEASEGMQGFPLAINLNANLVGNERDGVLRAESRFVRKGRRVCVVRTEVYSGERLLVDVTTNHVFSS